MNVVCVRDLTKYYGKNKGVEQVSFEVKEKEIFALLGPNGSGKSTTLRSLMGILEYEGTIEVLGTSDKKHYLKEIGYLPSETHFYPSMKVKEVIAYAAKMRHKDCQEEANKIIKRLEIDVEKRIGDLSLGNRKKVGIVCAMQHQPKLLILDEPTSGIDPLMQIEFFKLVEEYVNAGASVILSTHTLSEVTKYCHRVAMMKEGKIQFVDIVNQPKMKHVHCVLDGIVKDYVYEGDVNELIDQLSKQHLTDLTITEPTLEDVFIHYYEK